MNKNVLRDSLYHVVAYSLLDACLKDSNQEGIYDGLIISKEPEYEGDWDLRVPLKYEICRKR